MPDIIPERYKQLMDARIRIGSGSGVEDGKLPTHKMICIMEATAYILGYEYITDHPPCTSRVISDFMIELNDSMYITDRKRAQLKKVIPDIINTAPTRWDKDVLGNGKLTQIPAHAYGEYRRAENNRESMIEGFKEEHGRNHSIAKLPMTKILPLIRDLANVAHFTGADLKSDGVKA